MGALVVGLDVRRLYAITFGVGAACVGAAGALMITLIPVTPFLASEYTLLAFVIVIVGGLGSMTGALLGGLLIGVSEAVAGLLLQPSLKSMFSFGLLIVVLLLRPQGLLGRKDSAMNAARRASALAILLALLLAAPALLGGYGLSVLILVLYFAYVGQAWNIMMGFAGQLSLGHALYAGLGGYIAAGLYFHYGIGPWARRVRRPSPRRSRPAAIVGYLGFRFSLAGVYFALLTIAFAEFTRIGFDNWPWTGGSGGLFLQGRARRQSISPTCAAAPVLFYYVILALAVGAFVLCRLLLESRLGRYWLAIREDAEAAQARRRAGAALQDAGGDDLGRADRARRRVERLLLQQPLPRDGVRHGPLDRDDAGADHRRARHAVRPVRRRGRADRAGRDLHRRSASSSTSRASSRSSTASPCW